MTSDDVTEDVIPCCTLKCVSWSKRRYDLISTGNHNASEEAPKVALETSAIIKTHLNTCWSPTCKSNVIEQVP